MMYQKRIYPQSTNFPATWIYVLKRDTSFKNTRKIWIWNPKLTDVEKRRSRARKNGGGFWTTCPCCLPLSSILLTILGCCITIALILSVLLPILLISVPETSTTATTETCIINNNTTIMNNNTSTISSTNTNIGSSSTSTSTTTGSSTNTNIGSSSTSTSTTTGSSTNTNIGSSSTSTSTTTGSSTSTSTTTGSSTSTSTTTGGSSSSSTATGSTSTSTVIPNNTCTIGYSNSIQLFFLNLTSNITWTSYKFNFTSPNVKTVRLTFTFRDDPDFWYLDNVVMKYSSGQNLVSNGDFELGTFGNWIYCNPNNANFSGEIIYDPGFCFDSYCYADGSVGSPDYLSQVLSIRPNSLYTVSFQLRGSGDNVDSFFTWLNLYY